MFMKLDWGNVLKFADEREYYEVLGFLSKDEEYIRVSYKVMINLEHGHHKGDYY